jgi:hypothetical protein
LPTYRKDTSNDAVNSFEVCLAGLLSLSPTRDLSSREYSQGEKTHLKDEDAKRALRMQRNRESALRSRERRQVLWNELGKKNRELEGEKA